MISLGTLAEINSSLSVDLCLEVLKCLINQMKLFSSFVKNTEIILAGGI